MSKLRIASIFAARALNTSAKSKAPVSLKEPFIGAGNKGIVPTNPGYQKVARYQQLWATEDGSYVWQKRGIVDSFPYMITLLGSFIGVATGIYFIGIMSFPQKKD